MSVIEQFLDGAISGLGMWLMMTVMGVLSFFILKKRITQWAAKVLNDIKKEVVKLNGLTIEGKFKTHKEKKKK